MPQAIGLPLSCLLMATGFSVETGKPLRFLLEVCDILFDLFKSAFAFSIPTFILDRIESGEILYSAITSPLITFHAAMCVVSAIGDMDVVLREGSAELVDDVFHAVAR